jgi:hypothetical protein
MQKIDFRHLDIQFHDEVIDNLDLEILEVMRLSLMRSNNRESLTSLQNFICDYWDTMTVRLINRQLLYWDKKGRLAISPKGARLLAIINQMICLN